ncbi:NADPH-dependent F420 reductase [Nonomuraea typhae]|uniref:NADPH-dependent F420 reductase n=1 Tax=Nonomuraea typhae TaxID=2603600 RepID=UPI0012FBBB2D|nr:NAD(P)-binding domain-containing protein [Nonomuraea typhae]
MRIGILGAGNMADALGTRWIEAGHAVMISGRDPEKTRARAAGMGAAAGTFREAAEFGEVVLLAVLHDAADEVLEGLPLRGRTLVDCTNAVEDGRLLRDMAAHIARDTGAHVVKAFNLCHVDVWRMTPPVFGGRPLAVPLSGDDEGAVAAVRGLVGDLGCVPVDGGGLERAALAEATMAFMVGLWATGADAQAIVPPLEYVTGG